MPRSGIESLRLLPTTPTDPADKAKEKQPRKEDARRIARREKETQSALFLSWFRPFSPQSALVFDSPFYHTTRHLTNNREQLVVTLYMSYHLLLLYWQNDEINSLLSSVWCPRMYILVLYDTTTTRSTSVSGHNVCVCPQRFHAFNSSWKIGIVCTDVCVQRPKEKVQGSVDKSASRRGFNIKVYSGVPLFGAEPWRLTFFLTKGQTPWSFMAFVRLLPSWGFRVIYF